MYTRSYYTDDEKIKVPENYDGNAFTEIKDIKEPLISKEEPKDSVPLRAPWDVPKRDGETVETAAIENEKIKDGFLGDLMGKMPFGKLFSKGGFFKNTFSDFGTEELLIIGIALFLLLSKDGDKECAIILFFLVFVK